MNLDDWTTEADDPAETIADFLAAAFVFGLMVGALFAWLVVGAAAQ